MSNYLAIATVTETLAQLIRDAVGRHVPGAEVTMDRPDRGGASSAARVNLYLYQAAPNPALRNMDLPRRGADGQLVNRPRMPLDLHYLISFYGRDEQLIAQQLLAVTALTLHEHAVLSRAEMVRAIQYAPGGFLDASDLPDQNEQVKIAPLALNLEELSKLWQIMFQVPYTLTVAYQVSVVILDGSPAGQALPVRGAAPAIAPGTLPVVTSVAADGPAGTPITPGSTLVIQGTGLAGASTQVTIGPVVLTPAPADVTATQVRVALTDTRLVAGPSALTVSPSAGLQSAPAPFTLTPVVQQVQYRKGSGKGAPASLRLRISPVVSTTDAVTVLLNATGAGGGAQLAFDAPRAPATQPPKRTATVTVPVPNLPSGTYLVRAEVNGTPSALRTDATGTYAAPKVKVP